MIAPLIFLVSISLLAYLIGWQCVIVIGCIILFYIFLLILSRPLVKIRISVSKATDMRLKMINELISGIRTIRSYAWETPLMQKIASARNLEISRFTKFLCLRGFIMGLTRYVGLLLFLPLVLIKVLAQDGITAGDAYALFGLSLFTGYTSIAVFTFSLQSYTEFVAFMGRLRDLLIDDDFAPAIGTITVNEHQRVHFDQVAASWGFEQKISESSKNLSKHIRSQISRKPESKDECEISHILVSSKTNNHQETQRGEVISDINFTLNEGQLMAVIGHVGSGKSSLLATIMKECEVKKGELSVNGTIAYVEQEPFILSETVQENILLGEQIDEDHLSQVVRVCQLEPDLALFPRGIHTLIGEQGVNISGGQKARISLARALYANADIYLLDDPLSAVDPAVAQNIFNECIQGYLRSKTRILVTHQLHFTAGLSKVLLLDSNGSQKFYGSYDELLSENVIDIVKILESFQTSGADTQQKKRALSIFKKEKRIQDQVHQGGGSPILRRMTTGPMFIKQQLEVQAVHDEDRSKNLIITQQKVKGAVKCKDYCYYFGNGCGCLMNSLGALTLLSSILIYGGFQLFLADWVSQSPSNQRNSYYIAVCVIFIIIIIICTILVAIVISILVLYIGKNLHNRMIHSVSRTPTSFYDSNPSGRILNRFSKDTAVLDNQLTLLYFFIFGFSLQIILSLALSIYVIPLMGVVALLMFLMMLLFKRKMTVISAETLKWDGITRSPMNSLFSATIHGLMTIRAYSKQTYFVKKLQELVDENSRALFTFYAVSVWVAVRLNMLSFVYCSLNVACVILLKFWLNVDAILAGMSITLTMELGTLFSFIVRQSIEVENAMTSVLRIKEYIDLPSEAPSIEPGDQTLVQANWPNEGNIVFKNFSMRYRPQFEPVLQDLSFIVKAGMKVGVVGRTGAGKSSILQALFRLVEKDSGLIEIDGQDISKVGLTTLRERMAIIPQTPFLFIGSLKENLDPFKLYSSEQIWQALEDVQLAEFVRSSRCDSGLDTMVSDTSELFSVGQRQLLCLARAILRKSKILVMDQATANVDMETDELIQTTIRARFSNCTVLTVAHRLATIMDSDRVLVLGKGRVLEYDRPFTLLANNKEDVRITKETSHFAQMVLATGEQSAQSLFNVSKESYVKYFH